MLYARAASRRLRKTGSHGGPLTHAREKVLRALLYDFLNWQDGRCFPSYARIAQAAGVARSVVGEAILVIEALGIGRVVNRLVRVRWRERDGNGAARERWRVLRTSNAYEFFVPKSSTGYPQPCPQRESSYPQGVGSFPQASSTGSRSGTPPKSFEEANKNSQGSVLERALEGFRVVAEAKTRTAAA